MFKLSPPPSIANINAAQAYATLYSYLYQMSAYLNVAMNALTVDNFADEAKNEFVLASGSSKSTEKIEESLKAIIVQTADTVRNEMQTLQETFTGSITAISNEFGEYKAFTNNEITKNAEGILQQFQYIEDIDSKYGTFVNETNAYIKTGIIYYDGNTPVVGVAIGGDINNPRNHSATFTTDRLTFWNNGVELAYVSNSELYITNAHIINKLILGKWEQSHTHTQ